MTRAISILRSHRGERTIMATMVTAALLAVAWPLAATAGNPSVERLRPDVRTLELRDIQVSTAGPGRELRFSNEVANAGPGVLQVDPEGSEDCDGDGDPGNDRFASQRLYRDADVDGVFDPATDTRYKSIPAGCMAFHQAHDHWHFNDFARYKLRSNRTGERRAVSTKVSFCMRDNDRPFPEAPGSPASSGFGDCSQDRTMGISVGWSDVYSHDLPDQDLDISGLPDAWYCLSSVADPDGRLRETDDTNNGSRVKLQLTGRDVRLSERPCSSRAGG